MKLDELRLYSLLYIDEKNNINANIKKNIKNQIEIYIKCAATLNKSCQLHKIRYAVITNNKELLDRFALELGVSIMSYQVDFSLDVPDKIPFYSAHFKIEVFKELATGGLGEIVGLIDLDTIIINDLAEYAGQLEDDCIYYYNITLQEFDSGSSLIDSIKFLTGDKDIAHNFWSGGELLIAYYKLFGDLYNEIVPMWELYRCNYKKLYHCGDEMLTTAALFSLSGKGFNLRDLGSQSKPDKIPMIQRWWSARTSFGQQSFDLACNVCVLHLPSDKVFLASLYEKDINKADFLVLYKDYVRKKIYARKILSPFLNMLRKEKKKASSLD